MTEIAVFGGGCFWCTEAVFKRLKGVETVTSGYAGGQTENPSYTEVSSGDTGHAEVIKIIFDPSKISYEQLLEVFFELHDATTLNRQGNDVGPQYRSIILYNSEAQKEAAEKFMKKNYVTEIKPLDKFYTAEEYHQNYYDNNEFKPYCSVIISPKIRHLEEKFSKMLRR